MSDKLQLILESEEAMTAFKAHCYMDMQHEMCGLFVLTEGAVSFVSCDNQAFDKVNSFLIHPSDFVRCSENGDVIGVGHSHVIGSSKPSVEDRANAENCMLPFVIFQPEVNTVHTFDPRPGFRTTLLGRKWILGVSDCYTIARDYFKLHDVLLKDYVRNSLDVVRTESLFLKHFEENDFKMVEGPPRLNDVILMNIAASIPNHCAVMVEDNLILHHLQERLSCREPYGGYWRRHTTHILRHAKWS